MNMTNREVFERGTDAFNAHDLEAFGAVMTEDVAFKAPGGVQGHGKDACVASYSIWLSAFPDGHVEVHGVHFVDDLALEEGTFSGTHTGILATPAGDVPPTGRSVSAPYLQIVRFRDGKHASFNLVFDRLQMLEQLGLVPEPAAAG